MLTDESMVYRITGDYTVMLDSSHKYMWKCAITTSANHGDLATAMFRKKYQKKREWFLDPPTVPEAESPNRHWWARNTQKTSTQRLLQQHRKIIVRCGWWRQHTASENREWDSTQKKRKLRKNKKERDVRLRHLVGVSKPVRLAVFSWSDHYSQVQA